MHIPMIWWFRNFIFQKKDHDHLIFAKNVKSGPTEEKTPLFDIR